MKTYWSLMLWVALIIGVPAVLLVILHPWGFAFVGLLYLVLAFIIVVSFPPLIATHWLAGRAGRVGRILSAVALSSAWVAVVMLLIEVSGLSTSPSVVSPQLVLGLGLFVALIVWRTLPGRAPTPAAP